MGAKNDFGQSNAFKEKLLGLMEEYAFEVYQITKGFPSEEKYGIISQWRRASLSIALNYIEGNGRHKNAQLAYFYRISYGSAKECEMLQKFSLRLGFLSNQNDVKLKSSFNEMVKMLWTDLKNVEHFAED